ncbi:hypothetical protein ETA_34050 [Erwinia tasmaniensis Et1/99]|uniref:Uncharacterized protein n=1 Tax=Erwinia tasmaniensis (strain DSM 17950 / CFBP 7177 / CIP 109463 / NCPPB 4357 / Et1/99) TaxID=465817 RepID=B2VCJ6_ERWT9|nr:hypothetical protein ETA_34050 [Erwinia tasmaniensis Et1/99]
MRLSSPAAMRLFAAHERCHNGFASWQLIVADIMLHPLPLFYVYPARTGHSTGQHTLS